MAQLEVKARRRI